MRLPIVNVSKCPDRGLESLYELHSQPLDIYAWIIVFISIEQIYTLLLIGYRSHRKLTFQLSNTLSHVTIPTGLVLLWSVFTSFSVALVGLTMRGNISVLTKTLHVLIESYFLIVLFMALRLISLAVLVITITSFMFLWVISIPDCSNSVSLAVSLGVNLDFINFFSYLLLGCRQHSNKQLWTLVHGLGWHVSYLALFVIIHFAKGPPHYWVFANLRLMGGCFNIIAVEIFLLLLKEIHIDSGLPSGWMNFATWKSYPNAGVLWNKQGVMYIKNKNEVSHQPQQSAYTRDARWRFWFDYRNMLTIYDKIVTQYLCMFPAKYHTIPNENIIDDDLLIYVVDLYYPRLVRLLLSCSAGIVIYYM